MLVGAEHEDGSESVSQRVQSADHLVHSVDLALSETYAEPWLELPCEVFGNKAAWGWRGYLAFLASTSFRRFISRGSVSWS